ncbi:MAG: hypothetical protein Q9177_004561, partial [Variospora cf. flavescens]
MPFTPTSSSPFAEQRHLVLGAPLSDLHALPVPQHEERASDHHRNIFYAHRRVSRYASLFSAITAEEAERSASAVTPRSDPWNEPGSSRPQIERVPESPQLLPAIGSEWKQKKQQQQRSENSSLEETNGEGNALVLLPSNRASDVIVAPPPPPSGSNNPPAS